MRRLFCWCALVGCMFAAGEALRGDTPKDVPSQALAEIARRGALVERVAGSEVGDNEGTAIATVMQPPVDDSHKWLFTLVVTRNCQWCERSRRDFESDAKLKAWVDTASYEKSWAHWQVVQIEDPSQAWRWKDFRPTAFPTLIVQPPVNGSWGDAHTIVFARQGYMKPAELDAAIRKAISVYASKAYPRHLAWEWKLVASAEPLAANAIEQASPDAKGGFNPPAPPPAPLPPLPVTPSAPYPAIPPQDLIQPSVAGLLAQLLAGLLGGPVVANVLLLAILAWHIYRGIAKREGIPLLLDDQAAAEIMELLRGRRPTDDHRPHDGR